MSVKFIDNFTWIAKYAWYDSGNGQLQTAPFKLKKVNKLKTYIFSNSKLEYSAAPSRWCSSNSNRMKPLAPCISIAVPSRFCVLFALASRSMSIVDTNTWPSAIDRSPTRKVSRSTDFPLAHRAFVVIRSKLVLEPKYLHIFGSRGCRKSKFILCF